MLHCTLSSSSSSLALLCCRAVTWLSRAGSGSQRDTCSADEWCDRWSWQRGSGAQSRVTVFYPSTQKILIPPPNQYLHQWCWPCVYLVWDRYQAMQYCTLLLPVSVINGKTQQFLPTLLGEEPLKVCVFIHNDYIPFAPASLPCSLLHWWI